jgi:hypothetical protein
MRTMRSEHAPAAHSRENITAFPPPLVSVFTLSGNIW